MLRAKYGLEDGLVVDHRICETVSWRCRRCWIRIAYGRMGEGADEGRWGKGKGKEVDVRARINTYFSDLMHFRFPSEDPISTGARQASPGHVSPRPVRSRSLWTGTRS